MEHLVYFAALVSILGAIPYIRGIFKGEVQPNRVTWLLWAIAPLIGFFAAFAQDGFTVSEIPVFMAGFSPLGVFACSFFGKNSAWQIERLDIFCGVMSVLALVIWGLTKDPNLAIVFSILADAFAGLPTIIKAFKAPETEKLSPFLTGVFTPLPGLLAIQHVNFSQVAFPLYLMLLNCLIVSAILRGQHKNKLKKVLTCQKK